MDIRRVVIFTDKAIRSHDFRKTRDTKYRYKILYGPALFIVRLVKINNKYYWSIEGIANVRTSRSNLDHQRNRCHKLYPILYKTKKIFMEIDGLGFPIAFFPFSQRDLL